MKPLADAIPTARPDLRREDPLDARLVALYRAASPEKKLAAVHRLNRTLQGLKEAELAARRPELSEGERRAELRRWWFSDAIDDPATFHRESGGGKHLRDVRAMLVTMGDGLDHP